VVGPAAPSVPRSDLPRIKTWLKYGMTIAQVAQFYGLAIHDIEALLVLQSRFSRLTLVH
jgi:hypothetical protein